MNEKNETYQIRFKLIRYFSICRDTGIIDDIWSELKRASNKQLYSDVMISPKNVQSFKNVATRHRWQLSTMIKNVQKLIDKSKHESTSFNNSGYNFVNREGGIKEFRHLY